MPRGHPSDSIRVSPSSQSSPAPTSLVRALNERAPEAIGHLLGVKRLALAVGERLGFGPLELVGLASAAELADVGKIAIPEQVLHKPGPLDDNEWQLVRNHPVLGEELLSRHPELRSVARVVRSTHERWDGHGYPDGLRGQAIPISARIIAACDAFLAMTAARPYRPPLPEEAAVEELLAGAGTQFDPEVAYALLDAVAAGEHLEPREIPSAAAAD